MENSYFKMVDVGAKLATSRRAQAQGRILLSSAAMQALTNMQNPKGNVLALAESAGIMAAKNVAQLLPLCHPLPIEQVQIFFDLDESLNSVRVVCEVAVTAKTGAEMEALAGVNGALLCIYDLSKAVDPVLKITDIRLNLKTGGKSGEWRHPESLGSERLRSLEFKSDATREASIALDATSKVTSPAAHNTAPSQAPAQPLAGVHAAVVTISDRVSAGASEDRSGLVLSQLLQDAGAEVRATVVVADQIEKIKSVYIQLALESSSQLIISSGGTGLSPRDVTPEALADVCDRLIPGFGELLRADGARHVPTAWLSRACAGILRGKLLIALPGSPKAVGEGMAVLLPLLPHALHIIKGGDHAVLPS